MLPTGSASVSAVIGPGVMVRLPTGRVRAICSTVPAALVGTVAETESVHGAPVPRASVMAHWAEVPVAYSVLVPFSLTSDRAAPTGVAVRAPPEGGVVVKVVLSPGPTAAVIDAQCC